MRLSSWSRRSGRSLGTLFWRVIAVAAPEIFYIMIYQDMCILFCHFVIFGFKAKIRFFSERYSQRASYKTRYTKQSKRTKLDIDHILNNPNQSTKAKAKSSSVYSFSASNILKNSFLERVRFSVLIRRPKCLAANEEIVRLGPLSVQCFRMSSRFVNEAGVCKIERMDSSQ